MSRQALSVRPKAGQRNATILTTGGAEMIYAKWPGREIYSRPARTVFLPLRSLHTCWQRSVVPIWLDTAIVDGLQEECGNIVTGALNDIG